MTREHPIGVIVEAGFLSKTRKLQTPSEASSSEKNLDGRQCAADAHTCLGMGVTNIVRSSCPLTIALLVDFV